LWRVGPRNHAIATGGDSPIRDGPVRLAPRLAALSEHWSPRTVAEFNGHDIMHVLLIEPSGTPNTGDPDTAAPRQRT
jgi:hypothetical protein